MRCTRDLIFATVAIVAVVGALHYWRTNRPTQISGTVVDIVTGRAVPNVRVRAKLLNGSNEGVMADHRGRFTMPVSPMNSIDGLFVDAPNYAGLFGNLVGREGWSFRQGQQDSGVIVPAIPAVELSGRVLDDGGKPISGCQIRLFRPESPRGPVRLRAADRDTSTGPGGEYRFTNVSAGIYYLAASCNPTQSGASYLIPGRKSGELDEQEMWQTVLYPHARNIGEAQAVIATPGQRLRDLDFRVGRSRGYLLKGKFVWKDGDSPQMLDLYSNDLQVMDVSLGIPIEQIGGICLWNMYPGEFECPQMGPGSYRLRAMISPIWIEADRGRKRRDNDQVGSMSVQVSDRAPKPVLLEMHKVDLGDAAAVPKKPVNTGWLKVRLSGCGAHEFRWMNDTVWDEQGRRVEPLTFPQSGKHAWQWELAPGRYRVSAVCRAYWGHFAGPYLDEVLQAQGTTVEVRPGLVTEVRVRALGAEEIYRIAVAHIKSLQEAQARQ